MNLIYKDLSTYLNKQGNIKKTKNHWQLKTV